MFWVVDDGVFFSRIDTVGYPERTWAHVGYLAVRDSIKKGST